jgi:acetyl-CoA synthetase
MPRDEEGYYRIIRRVDDVVIVSDIILQTATHWGPIKWTPSCCCRKYQGHDVKGNALYGFVILEESGEIRTKKNSVQRN